MDLSKDPTSVSTILALLRNHERFAKWVNGKPLGKFTYVSLRKDLPEQIRRRNDQILAGGF